MRDQDVCCHLLAGPQHGCVSLGQARRCGLSDDAIARRVRSRQWRRVLPRVYVVRGTPATWQQSLWAALLWAGDGSVASGASAARLWGLPGFEAGPPEVTNPARGRTRPGIVLHRAELPQAHTTRRAGFPVTTVPRTLVDVAARVGPERVDYLMHHCLHMRLTTLEDLEGVGRDQTGPGFPGARLLREALRSYGTGRAAASPLEVRLAQRIARSGLPPPTRQHEVRVHGRRYYLDFAWPEVRVAVEVDGYRWHSSRTAWERDRARLRELRRAGWTVVQATKEDVDAAFDRLLSELRSLIEQ